VLGVVLVIGLAACGGGGDESTAADSESAAAVEDTSAEPAPTANEPVDTVETTAVAASVDADALATYDCVALLALVDDVAGPGSRTTEPFDAAWMTGTMKGGCVITGDDAVSVEVHLANADEHSFPFSWRKPSTVAEQEASVLSVGDEAYYDDDPQNLVARRGLVEVSLGVPFLYEGAVMDRATMERLADALLAPWPSGPGADERPTDEPPSIPLPSGSDPRDWHRFDPAELNAEFVAQGIDPPYDTEIMLAMWSMEFAQTELVSYCETLAAAGFSAEDALAAYGATPDDIEFTGGGPGCIVTDRDVVVVVANGYGDIGGLLVTDYDAVLRQQRICAAAPDRCDDL
jgi:hypothetical protein